MPFGQQFGFLIDRVAAQPTAFRNLTMGGKDRGTSFGSNTDIRDAFQHAGIEIDHQRIVQIEPRHWPGKEICRQHTHTRPRAEGGQQGKAICCGASVNGNLSGPRLGMRRDHEPMRRLILA